MKQSGSAWKFSRFLFSQLENKTTRSDAVMVLANYAARDVNWPIHALKRGRFAQHLKDSGAPEPIIESFQYAWVAWLKRR